MNHTIKKTFSALLCLCLVLSLLPAPVLAATNRIELAEQRAEILRELGLFEGVSDTNFDLERRPSRTEALIMLVRAMGKKQEALSGNWTHPFTDVPGYADPYVGYAYTLGLTEGISDTLFGGSETAGAAVYLTFMLRALGYSDGEGADFAWDDPYLLAGRVGLLPAGVNTVEFLRADVALVTFAALSSPLKDGSGTLGEKLTEAGQFTSAQLEQALNGTLELPSASPSPAPEPTPAPAPEPENRIAHTAEQIYAECSPAVFQIIVYTQRGDAYGQGSGFFIDAGGTAVTNYHVLEEAYTAQAILSDGRSFDINGVLYADAEMDYAVFKVNGSGFATLPVGNSSTVKGGETIYTLGNPRGMTNTISNGIVSNPVSDYQRMISITAPISSGSSGGALINAYGEVIGVTTGTITDSQNLNLAVPINTVIRSGSPAAYEQLYGLTPLPEFSAAARKTGSGEASGAFDALRRFVMENTNFALDDGTPGWFYTLEDIDYGVVYSPYSEALILTLINHTRNGDFCSFLFVTPGSEEVFSSFSYYQPGSNTVSIRGSATVAARDLAPDMPYAFTQYEGVAQYRRTLEKEVLEMFLESLNYVNYLFENLTAPAGTYTVADLGFTGFTGFA